MPLEKINNCLRNVESLSWCEVTGQPRQRTAHTYPRSRRWPRLKAAVCQTSHRLSAPFVSPRKSSRFNNFLDRGDLAAVGSGDPVSGARRDNFRDSRRRYLFNTACQLNTTMNGGGVLWPAVRSPAACLIVSQPIPDDGDKVTMPGVRLAIGSNAASVWWINRTEVIASTTPARPLSTTAYRDASR